MTSVLPSQRVTSRPSETRNRVTVLTSPVASVFPSGENSSTRTGHGKWSSQVTSRLRTFQRMSEWSVLPVASVVPSGEKRTTTRSEWKRGSGSVSRVATFQSSTAPVLLPSARSEPSGDMSALVFQNVVADVPSAAPEATSQVFTERWLAFTRVFPSGENPTATPRALQLCEKPSHTVEILVRVALVPS